MIIKLNLLRGDVNMNLPQSMQFMVDGKPTVKRSVRDPLDRIKRVQAYVTLGSMCNSQCGFCRNKVTDTELMKQDSAKLFETLKEYSPYIHTMVFGGDEPLLYSKRLEHILNNVLDKDVNSYLITNGSRIPFFTEINSCKLCKRLNGVMLSRHHYDRQKNAAVFGNPNLITEREIKYEVCDALRNKLEFATTCFKGGIDSATEILNFIEWGKMLGVNKFLFNNLQKDATVEKYFKNHQIDSSVFVAAEDKLISSGYNLGSFICSNAGYDITTYTKEGTRVGFKRYHSTVEETIERWKCSIKHTFDVSIMPNGGIFSDWTNKYKI